MRAGTEGISGTDTRKIPNTHALSVNSCKNSNVLKDIFSRELVASRHSALRGDARDMNAEILPSDKKHLNSSLIGVEKLLRAVHIS